jgi:Flp pilus assembly protein TadG
MQIDRSQEAMKRLKRFIDRVGRAQSLRQRAACRGQSLVEFALLVPVIFLLILNAINIGGFIYSWITVANAARAAGQFAILGASSVGLPHTGTAAQLQTLVTNETSSLPNASSTNPTVTACENDNGTVFAFPQTTPTTACAVGVTVPPTDPEAPGYVTLAVDVTYTFTPFVPAFSFPLTALPGTIHRRVVMRMLQ